MRVKKITNTNVCTEICIMRNFFLKAYQNIYAKEGNMTAGTDGKTIDGMGNGTNSEDY